MKSASQSMLDHMDKATRATAVPGILSDCKDAGIRFHLFSIIGFPEETESMARETYRFFLDDDINTGRPGQHVRSPPFLPRAARAVLPRSRAVRNRDGAGRALARVPGRSRARPVDEHPWHDARGTLIVCSKNSTPGWRGASTGCSGTASKSGLRPRSTRCSFAGTTSAAGATSRTAPSLPDRDSGLMVSLRINPAIGSRFDDDVVWLATEGHSTMLARPHRSGDPGQRRARASEKLEAELGAENLERLDALLAAGLLQLRGSRSAEAASRALKKRQHVSALLAITWAIRSGGPDRSPRDAGQTPPQCIARWRPSWPRTPAARSGATSIAQGSPAARA